MKDCEQLFRCEEAVSKVDVLKIVEGCTKSQGGNIGENVPEGEEQGNILRLCIDRHLLEDHLHLILTEEAEPGCEGLETVD